MISEEEKVTLKKELHNRIKHLDIKGDVKDQLLTNFIEYFDAGFLCYYCGVKMELKFGTDLSFSIDHVIPQSKGGKNTIENLKICCWRCNSTKKDKGVTWFMRNLKLLQEKRKKKIHTVELSKAIKTSVKDKRIRESYEQIFAHLEAKGERAKGEG